MRVLMLVSEAPPIKSGISRVAGELTNRLRSRGVEVDVLSANEIPRWTFKEFRFSSLALHWPSVQAHLGDYDILHVHGTVPTFSDAGLIFGRLGTRLARPGSAVVYTHHSDIDIAGLDIPVGIYNAIHRRLLGLADHVVASTPSYAMQLEGVPRPGRISAVAFGVDAGRFSSPAPKPDRFNVLFVGQLRPYKGVDVLLRAWRKVKNADLHIVGDGHERENLEALAAQLGLKSVHFHGSVTDKQLKEFYANSHALVLPSKRKAEAFGLVLLEAMAAGCVPIAADLPGVSDVVATTGYTFPVGDHEALTHLLRILQQDPVRREDMSVLATARALACDWDYTAEAYDGIYKQAHLGRLLEVAMEHGPLNFGSLQDWLHGVAGQAGADRASLMLIDPRDRHLMIAASVGLGHEIVQSTHLPVGQRMAGFAAHTGRPMLLKRRGMPHMARLYMSAPQLTSALILPLTHRGKPIGVLNLARGADRLSFTEADQRWLQRLAMQVAPLLKDHGLPLREVARRENLQDMPAVQPALPLTAVR